jgi:hypothetical protein
MRETASLERLNQALRYDQATGKVFCKSKCSIRLPVGDEVGHPHTKGHVTYLRATVDGVRYYVHTLVWLMLGKKIPDGMMIDHEDGNGLNNRLSNLRLVTRSGNAKNMRRRLQNTSGTSGIAWCKQTKTWKCRVRSEGREVWIGRFSSIDEAKSAVFKARLDHGFHQNHGR